MKLLSKCCLATLLNPLGGRTTYVVGLGVLSCPPRSLPRHGVAQVLRNGRADLQ